MEQQIAIDSAPSIVGTRSQDERWMIVAILDPALVSDLAVRHHSCHD